MHECCVPYRTYNYYVFDIRLDIKQSFIWWWNLGHSWHGWDNLIIFENETEIFSAIYISAYFMCTSTHIDNRWASVLNFRFHLGVGLNELLLCCYLRLSLSISLLLCFVAAHYRWPWPPMEPNYRKEKRHFQ